MEYILKRQDACALIVDDDALCGADDSCEHSTEEDSPLISSPLEDAYSAASNEALDSCSCTTTSSLMWSAMIRDQQEHLRQEAARRKLRWAEEQHLSTARLVHPRLRLLSLLREAERYELDQVTLRSGLSKTFIHNATADTQRCYHALKAETAEALRTAAEERGEGHAWLTSNTLLERFSAMLPFSDGVAGAVGASRRSKGEALYPLQDKQPQQVIRPGMAAGHTGLMVPTTLDAQHHKPFRVMCAFRMRLHKLKGKLVDFPTRPAPAE